jgi:hypothetical protein
MIAATFHGQNHFVPNYYEGNIEVFTNIGHALSALFDRYDTKGKRALPVIYLDGLYGDIPFPDVELGDSFEVYNLSDSWQSGPLRAETVEDVLTAVHAGLWDYKLRLMRPFNFPGDTPDSKVAVAVEKRVAL